MKKLRVIGHGALYLGSNGQKARDLRDDPLAKEHAPKSYKESGFDTAHLGQYDGTNFAQWHGRRRDGCFHPWGPIFEIYEAEE